MNRQLHGERIMHGTHTRRVHAMPWRELPDGVFVRAANGPAVVVDDDLTTVATSAAPGTAQDSAAVLGMPCTNAVFARRARPYAHEGSLDG